MTTQLDVARMPAWLKKRFLNSERAESLSSYLTANSIETVCVNSRCPNMNECYSTGNVSFLILGNTCTRSCLFCAIEKGKPDGVNELEPQAIAKVVRRLSLKYVVITSVTRDDIDDGGAVHYASVVRAIKGTSPSTRVETLVPDFKGNMRAIDTILDAGADVFSHNMETVSRFYPEVRPDFDYSRSLGLLRYTSSRDKITTKSGFMVGLGESEDEIEELMSHIRNVGCDILTIGQYLRPHNSTFEVKKFVHPEVFNRLKEKALKLGFKKVASGPFVRSSYRAGEL